MSKSKSRNSAVSTGESGASISKEKPLKRLRILFAASEVYPLIKTGGLADVACYLPLALHELGHDVRIVMPAYRSVLDKVSGARRGKNYPLEETGLSFRILQTRLPGSTVPMYLVDIPELYDRRGGPYRDPSGNDWEDNARRYAAFGRVIRLLGLGRVSPGWRPDIVHCNDWHTGLAPALLAQELERPAIVFSIHNLAYQGDFSYQVFQSLNLPQQFWSPQSLEFYGRVSFIKGGLVYADRLIAVSPSYAREIMTPEFGYGLEGLLRHRQTDLLGILNGVDYRYWDPRHDPLIAQHYWIDNLDAKAVNKHHLQQELGLRQQGQALLLAHISRLTWQKGIDLILEGINGLMQNENVQMVVLGSGEANYEHELQIAAQSFPGRLSINLTYDEALAHRIQAGADMLLMPSRYEPCGLTQMYSMRYGTIPIVRRSGGLADTIIDATSENLSGRIATGFCFNHAGTADLLRTTQAAIASYRSDSQWRQLMQTAMQKDFTWKNSAEKYIDSYRELLTRASIPSPVK